MKCYFCLTEPDEQNSVYLDLLYVSLKSARQNTTLDLYALYDGSSTGRCYEILKEFDVHIIEREFSHKKDLEKTYTKEDIKKFCGREVPYSKIAGTFMRFDIPFVEQEDEYVLYTDIDVIFLKDFLPDGFAKPQYLAATAEFEKDPDKMTYFNAGVLYLNVKNMRDISAQIFEMLKNGIKNQTGLFDQGYLNQLCFDKMTVMPLEFNWKPYWGYNADARIIHLHAMKPGGNFANSGFAMTESALYNTLKNHFQDVDGYVYYILKYYEILGQDGKKWVSDFISQVFQSVLAGKSKENEFKILNEITSLKEAKQLFSQQLALITESTGNINDIINNRTERLETQLSGLDDKVLAADAFKNRVDALETQLSGLDDKVLAADAFKNRVDALEAKLSGLDDKVLAADAFKNRVDALETQLSGLDNKVLAADAFKNRVDALETQISGLDDKVLAADAFKNRVDALEAKLSGLDDKVLAADAFKNRVDALETQLSGLDNKVLAADAFKNGLNRIEKNFSRLDSKILSTHLLENEINRLKKNKYIYKTLCVILIMILLIMTVHVVVNNMI